MTIQIPRWVVQVGALLLSCVLGAVIALLTSGGKGDADAEPRVVTTTTTVTETADADTASAASEPDVGAEEAAEDDERDCDALGINSKERKEGTCSTDGQRVTVVNRDSTLQLKELDARLLSIDTPGSTLSNDLGTERANGTFVIVRLAITNKLNTPVYFEDGIEPQVYLLLDDSIYTPQFEVANGIVEDSFVWQGKEIQPKTTQEGSVIFDVPEDALADLDRSGNIQILNFSDVDRSRPRLPIGVIRTYD